MIVSNVNMVIIMIVVVFYCIRCSCFCCWSRCCFFLMLLMLLSLLLSLLFGISVGIIFACRCSYLIRCCRATAITVLGVATSTVDVGEAVLLL